MSTDFLHVSSDILSGFSVLSVVGLDTMSGNGVDGITHADSGFKEPTKMFNTRQFLIDNYKTPTELAAFLSAYGFDVKPDTVHKWFYRGGLPGDWWPILLGLTEMDRGGVPTLQPYFQ